MVRVSLQANGYSKKKSEPANGYKGDQGIPRVFDFTLLRGHPKKAQGSPGGIPDLSRGSPWGARGDFPSRSPHVISPGGSPQGIPPGGSPQTITSRKFLQIMEICFWLLPHPSLRPLPPLAPPTLPPPTLASPYPLSTSPPIIIIIIIIHSAASWIDLALFQDQFLNQ